jgi:quercetin dioxygenase-like cupin family protein
MLEVLPKQPTAKGPAEWFTGDVFIDVTEGKGLVQSRGDAIEEIRAGDVITTPLASGTGTAPPPDHFMTHLSISKP